jgi:hypothetical protein
MTFTMHERHYMLCLLNQCPCILHILSTLPDYNLGEPGAGRNMDALPFPLDEA